jgi:hypothetical protein
MMYAKYIISNAFLQTDHKTGGGTSQGEVDYTKGLGISKG